MRTVTYIGLIAIADAINKNWHSGEFILFYAVILGGAIIMDIVEFLAQK